ncbi:MAG: type II secretion system protein [Akkermansiaceae bacterium]
MNTHIPSSSPVAGTRRRRVASVLRQGFTLLEVVLALGLMGMLIGGVYLVAQTSVKLSQTVVDAQNSAMERSAFFKLMKNHFEQIPGNAVLRLESYDGSSDRQLFTLTFQNVPMSFNWGETPVTAEAIELVTVEQRDGFIDVILRIYDEEILADSDSAQDATDIEPIAEIVLLEDLWHCDCEVVDGRDLEQALLEWDNNGQLPLLVKFYCRFEPTSDIVQQTFWIVPKQRPEVFMRQVLQQNPGGPASTEGGAQPGTPGGVDITLPGTGGAGSGRGTPPGGGGGTSGPRPPISGNGGR